MPRKIVTLKIRKSLLAKIAVQKPLAPKPGHGKRAGSPVSRSQSPRNKSRRSKPKAAVSMTPSQSASSVPSRSTTPAAGNRGFSGNNMRIGGLTMNSHTTSHLDKSGKPCARWVKADGKSSRIRTFTGFDLCVPNWEREGGPKGGPSAQAKKKQPLITKGPAVKVL